MKTTLDKAALTMDLKQLEYFVQVADMGSFTRAANFLNVTQPALSRQIRQLEVELRQNLMTRNGRGAKLTEAGRLLLEHGRGILHQVEVAKEEMSSMRGALAGRVSIGLPPSLSKLITVPLTLAFLAEMPHAHLSMTEGFSVLMYEALRAGRLDMAVLYNPTHSPDLEMSVLHEDALVLISAQNNVRKISPVKPRSGGSTKLKNQIPLADVAQLPLILPSRPNAFRQLIDTEMVLINAKPNIVLEIDGLNAILELVKQGLGYAVLPHYTLRNFEAPHPFATHVICKPKLMSQLMVVWSARRPMTASQQAALVLVKKVVTASLLN